MDENSPGIPHDLSCNGSTSRGDVNGPQLQRESKVAPSDCEEWSTSSMVTPLTPTSAMKLPQREGMTFESDTNATLTSRKPSESSTSYDRESLMIVPVGLYNYIAKSTCNTER